MYEKNCTLQFAFYVIYCSVLWFVFITNVEAWKQYFSTSDDKLLSMQEISKTTNSCITNADDARVRLLCSRKTLLLKYV